MKYLLVLAVLGVALYLWRQGRHRSVATPPPSPPPTPDTMVRCRHCGVHLPGRDAVRGALGDYCGHEHRSLAER